MRKLLRKILFLFYRPYCMWVISDNRTYKYNGLTLQVPKGVFHPGLFFSTKYLAKELLKLNLQQKKVLEVGCGSGLISILAARKGALVTSIDINPAAVRATADNAVINGVTIHAYESDLFSNVVGQTFDILVINPPYFKKNPSTPAAAAWYAGESYQYFEKLFAGIDRHIKNNSLVLMVASEDVDTDLIRHIANKNNFTLSLHAQAVIMLERNFIFSIKNSTSQTGHLTGRASSL